ncbi:MAG: UDP-N-acetylglucosamine--N-acetylmuramyl-(pentapeptide) pyrophosphoryl-undecaprenol N-acetylglucosamine transferase, partial [Bacilli bacterium]
VTFMGIKGQMEEELFFGKTIFLTIPNSFKKSIKNIKSLMINTKCKKMVKDFDVTIVFGGFISFYVTYFLHPKNIFIHEQNVMVGDSNKACYPLCKKMFTSFPIEGKKTIYASSPSADRFFPKKYVKNIRNILFIFGSLGSSILLEKTIKFAKNNTKYHITIVCGKNVHTNNNDNFCVSFLDVEKDIYNYDLIFTRGGATTLKEIMKTRIPFVVIPSLHVKRNHQTKNAESLKDFCLIIKEKDYDERTILEKINQFENEDFRYKIYLKHIQLPTINSCQTIYEELKKYA